MKNDFSDQFFKDIAKIESKEQLEIGIKCQNMAMIKNACDAGKICAYRTAIIHAVYWKTPLTVFRSIITINKEYIDESEDAPESLARSKDALIYAIEKKLYDHLKCLLEYNPNTNLANSYLYYYPDATAKKILQEHSKKQARKIS